MLRRLIDSPYLLWLLLALPGAVIIVRYATGASFYGEVVLATGDLSAKLLIATLAVTPLTLMFPGRPWVRWLLGRRRYLGVAARLRGVALQGVVPAARSDSYWLKAPRLLTGMAILVTDSSPATPPPYGACFLHRWV